MINENVPNYIADKFYREDCALTFDDVLICPMYSEVLPSKVNTKTKLTDNIFLNIPIISSPMDMVTEWKMAYKLAQLGGLGVIHRNMSIDAQIKHVSKVKRSESSVIKDPITAFSDQSILEIKNIMNVNSISGIPILNRSNNKLIGIITNRDVRFLNSSDSNSLEDIMTKDPYTVQEEDACISKFKSIFHKYRIEKLPIVNKNNECVGLVTFKDMKHTFDYPTSSRMDNGELIVGAAAGADFERCEALIAAGVDVLFIETAHGNSKRVIDTVKKVRDKYSNVVISAGNIVNRDGAIRLYEAGADIVKVGIGPGSICTTRIIAGVGYPQLSALLEVSNAIRELGITCIADGGIKYSGDIVKSLAAGASAVMLGSLLAGTDESPGEVFTSGSGYYKKYRGMGSKGAMDLGRYAYSKNDKFTPEGVEASVAYKGSLKTNIDLLVGGLMSGMGYIGAKDISQLYEKSKFIKISNAGLRESHPHSVKMDSTKN